MLEKDIQNQCMEYFKIVTKDKCWRVNTKGALAPGMKRFIKPSPKYGRTKGILDCILFYSGFTVFVEFKTPKTKSVIRPEQKEFISCANDNGSLTTVIWEFNQAKQLIKDLDAGVFGMPRSNS